MQRGTVQKIILLSGLLVLAYLAVRYLLPVALPFLLGAALALAAEPAVRLGERKLGLKRGLAAGLGVSATLVLLLGLLVLLGSILVREASQLGALLPDASDALSKVQNMAKSLVQRCPESIRPMLNTLTQDAFGSGDLLTGKAAQLVSGFAGNILSHLPGSALGLATGVISAFMISARLPKLRQLLSRRVPESVKNSLGAVRGALGGWLKAQCKLSGVSFLIITMGLIILKVPYAPVWGFCIALVDAFPMLGTGAVMVPWALVRFLQGDSVFALGLLGTYAAAALSRSVLEPKLVGSHLGLDPLVTLVAMYAGFRFFGFAGMLLAPMLAVAAAQVVRPRETP